MQGYGFGAGSKYAMSQVSNENSDSMQNGNDCGGLFTKEECKNLSKKIIEAYDEDRDGICQTLDVAKWLVDCYRAMKKTFQPTATDIASYIQVVDRQRKGKISQNDLEDFIMRSFYNPQKQN